MRGFNNDRLEGVLSHTALLALENGMVFYGHSIGVKGEAVGEIIFNTSMTGYQEILTDPSYANQIITFTYPHIGNVGVNELDMESTKPWAVGIVIRDLSTTTSNWRAQTSLQEFLNKHEMMGIAEIDTRRLTRVIREQGALKACLMAGELNADAAIAKARQFSGLNGVDLARAVSVKEPYLWEQGEPFPSAHLVKSKERLKVLVYDFGVKQYILRMLHARGCQVTVIPAETSIAEIQQYQPQGVCISNGPGDPAACTYAFETIRYWLDKGTPFFGICLGFQLLALACGAKTVKMKFGHHGANHPVLSIEDKRILITSQNHGFAVDESTLPNDLRVTHRSLFDNSLQGLEHVSKPAFGFQGHPEASPGPHDVSGLFDRFIKMMQQKEDSYAKK